MFKVLILLLSACGDNSGLVQSIVINGTQVSELVLVAGQLGGIGNANGPVGRFAFPKGIAVNDNGVIYVSDSKWGPIRSISPSGIVSNFPTTPMNQAWHHEEFDNGESYRSALAIDAQGNLYVAGNNDCSIKRITQGGVVSIFAGEAGCGYHDGEKRIAQFGRISSIAIDAHGAIYVVDGENSVIRKISPMGWVTTLAGRAGAQGDMDGHLEDAQFNNPIGIAIDATGVIFVSDQSGQKLRRISLDGWVSTIPIRWADSGELIKFRPWTLGAMVIDSAGTLHVIYETKIIKISQLGDAKVFVGGGNFPNPYLVRDGWGRTITLRGNVMNFEGVGVWEFTDGMLSVDKDDNLYYADPIDRVVRKISPNGWVSTIAGKHELDRVDSLDGRGADVRFAKYADMDNNFAEVERQNTLLADKEGNIYVKRRGYMAKPSVRKLSFSGEVSSLEDMRAYPDAIAKDGTSFWYSSDYIYRSPQQKPFAFWSKVLAGTSNRGRESRMRPLDGLGEKSIFFNIMDICLDSQDNLYVIDRDVIYAPLLPPPWVRPRLPDMGEQGGLIRKVSPDGLVTTLAGSIDEHGFADGYGGQARFHVPSSLAVDSSGNIFVADTYNHAIRKINPTGLVTTFAGTPTRSGSQDGLGRKASFNFPNIIVFDKEGNLYVADSGNFLIRKITPFGEVTTIAGTPGSRGVILGSLPASLSYISGMTFDAGGTLYLYSENSLLKLVSRGE